MLLLAFEVVGVPLGEARPLLGQVVLREDSRNGTNRNARAAIDALDRIDVDHINLTEIRFIFFRVDAIYRAGVYARGVFGSDAGFCDYVCHMSGTPDYRMPVRANETAPYYRNVARILAIETSCDETAACVLEDGIHVLSNVVASQMQVHAKYGGVVPELASREHLRAIVPVVAEALERAGISWEGIDAVAATSGPGLAGALLVGLTYAKAIAFARSIPLIAAHHIEGHIRMVMLEALQQGREIELPAIALVVSGGHTHLYEVAADGYRLLGKTRDDAAGEAFDKVAKLLGFGYPGGPVIGRIAVHGNPLAVPFTSPRMKGSPLDFSFSGYKTAVVRWVAAQDIAEEIEARRALLRETPYPSTEQWLAVTPQITRDLVASFQHAVVRELLDHITDAVASVDEARSVIVTGGVACNARLREEAGERMAGLPVYFPAPNLSTDNAVMIAAAAWPKFVRREFSTLAETADPAAALAI